MSRARMSRGFKVRLDESTGEVVATNNRAEYRFRFGAKIPTKRRADGVPVQHRAEWIIVRGVHDDGLPRFWIESPSGKRMPSTASSICSGYVVSRVLREAPPKSTPSRSRAMPTPDSTVLAALRDQTAAIRDNTAAIEAMRSVWTGILSVRPKTDANGYASEGARRDQG